MKKFGIGSAIKVLWKVGNKKNRLCFIFLMFAGIIRAVSELIIPLITACVISKLSGESAGILGIYFPEDISITTLIIVCFIILFGFYFTSSGIRALTRLFASSMKAKTNVYAVKLLLEERKNCNLKMTNGEASYIIKSSSDHVASFIETGIIKIICPVITSIMAIVYISVLSPVAIAVLAVGLVLVATCVFGRAYFDGRTYKKLEKISGDINNHVLNDIENLSFISFLKSKLVELNISKELNKHYYKTDKRRIVTYIVYWLCVYAVQFACAISVVLLILRNETSDIQVASTLIVVIPYLLQIFSQVDNLGAMIGDCQRYGISISRVELIKSSPQDLIVQTKPSPLQDYVSLKVLPTQTKIKKLEVKDMKVRIGSFEHTYNSTFNFGQINCIMGLSGGGKTTLLNALLGLIEHEQGGVIVNDKYLLNNLFFENNRISISFQGENFFDRSIEENVMYPNTELNENAKSLIKTFSLEEILERKKKEGENFKSQLSGGEKKRLSIIRCLSKDAQIYILDEPTNELDERNVKKAIKQLEKVKRNAMVIVISHDKRLIERSENLIVL